MGSILVIKSSAGGAASVSNKLVDQLVARLQAERPELKVVERDLDREPVPHLSSATMAGIGRPAPETEAAKPTRALSDALVAELQEAEILVIGAPMYNFGIASTLKSWFDHVLRAGVTFQYGPNGPEGLVAAKPVIVIETRGGAYSEGPAAVLDSQEPHLRTMLGFMGLRDVDFVRVEKLAMAAQEQIAAAVERIGALRPGALAKAA
ncbi:FMN-dependent NADH-azoreductase [Sphingomonas oleivorans]|uniref:FMN dependent NADH:quinone oxidoreductase n=1 Tax=Sphingomonas oleivorans TaxID=1735121 RepID=A0A2T5FVW9_9SPHN|nr:NAD(P)H-dependent oxidoreductase [Sphingomonas oleivorans]PTQ09924.1 FMN-dependent NADH-azoreductase [Sphingomonas oleivorans]